MSADEIPAVSFEEASVLADARGRHGGADFEDTSFLEPLRHLLADLDAAPLHAGGRFGQYERIIASLGVRLTFEDYCRRHPEILDEEIVAPLVVVGQTRTGTTRLHRLLASDPGLYSAHWWEVRSPAPFPDWDGTPPDPRIAEAHEQVRIILETQPVLASIHPWDAEGPDEEIMLMEHTFLSQVPESSTHIPNYFAWIDEQDWTGCYAYLKKLLQFLQWQKHRRGETADRWVLKTPAHLGYIDTMLEIFPGAVFIQTHRDPLETVASSASMYAALWGMSQDEVDHAEIGRQTVERFSWGLRRNMASRRRLKDEGFVDVWFADVGRDALGELRRIYDEIGRELTPEAEAAMKAWLRDNAREKRPAHRYTLEQFGLTREHVESTFSEYRERFILSRSDP
mgnify:CR=1 FL=1